MSRAAPTQPTDWQARVAGLKTAFDLEQAHRIRAEERVEQLEDILCRASRLAESQQADLVQQVIQEAWKGDEAK